MIFRLIILILSLVVWACIGNAFAGVVRDGMTQTPGLQVVYPVSYQIAVYLLIPLIILLIASGQVMKQFKMLSFVRLAMGIILTVDWVYLAFIEPPTVMGELTGAAHYSSASPTVYVVNFRDLILFFSFNLFSFVVIAIFTEMARTYRKERGL